MFALTLMQGPAKILIGNIRIGLYGSMNSGIYRYFHYHGIFPTYAFIALL